MRQVTFEPGGVVAGAVWHPDGKRIAYNRSGSVPSVMYTSKSWNEQTPEPFAPAEGGQFWVRSWSLDGRLAEGFPPLARHVVLYSLVDKTYSPLTTSGDHAVWLNDSRRLLYEDRNEIHLIDVPTRKSHKVLSVAPFALNSRFSLSPDNRSLYYRTHSSEADIWLMSLK